jgi:hypothetical protein
MQTDTGLKIPRLSAGRFNWRRGEVYLSSCGKRPTPMFSFPHAISILEEEGMLTPIPKQVIADAPLYVNHHGDQEITMPSREAWQTFKISGEFQRVLPAPITKTIQTAKSLRSFRIYSILMSDGDKLVTKKILASDTLLLLVLQVFEIDRVLQAVTEPGQPLNAWNKCYSVRPKLEEVPESKAPMPELVKILAISTMNFLYSVHVDPEKYQVK